MKDYNLSELLDSLVPKEVYEVPFLILSCIYQMFIIF